MRQIQAYEGFGVNERVGKCGGEEIVLEIEIAEGVGRGEDVGGKGAGEGVVAEAEGVEIGEIGDGVGRKAAGEPCRGEVELDDGRLVWRADDAGPGAGGEERFQKRTRPPTAARRATRAALSEAMSGVARGRRRSEMKRWWKLKRAIFYFKNLCWVFSRLRRVDQV